MLNQTFRRHLSLFLAIFYFATQVVLGSVRESSIWAERKIKKPSAPSTSAVQIARLPVNFPPIQSSLPSITATSPQKKSLAALPKGVKNLLSAVPWNAASLRDAHDARNPAAPSVILIQDVHLNNEAQTNIAAVLQNLLSDKAVSMVGIEGAFAAIDLKPFHAVTDKAAVKTVADSFLKNNLLSAPTYAGILNPATRAAFIGVDDKAHYDKNVAAYLGTRDAKKKIGDELRILKGNLSERKRKILSPELARFDGLRSANKAGEMNLGPYVRNLAALAKSAGNPAGGLIVEQFLEAYEIESRLDFQRVENERRDVIEKLTRSLNEKETTALIEQSLAYRMGRIGFGDYYQSLKELCERKGVELRRSPAFDNYIRYVLLADGIRAESLLAAIGEMEEKLLNKLAVSDEEKELAAQSEFVVLSEKLIEFALTPEEWEKYGKLKSQIPINKSQTKSNKQTKAWKLESLDVAWNLSSFESFYTEADARSEKIVENLLKEVRGAEYVVRGEDTLRTPHHVPRTAVLVIGGFHTPHVTKLLKERNVSYVTLAPKITRIEDLNGSAYLSAFAREKTPLDKLFSGEKLFICPSRVHATGATAVEMLASIWRRVTGTVRVQFRYENRDISLDVRPQDEQDAAKDVRSLPLMQRLLVFSAFGPLWETAVFQMLLFELGRAVLLFFGLDLASATLISRVAVAFVFSTVHALSTRIQNGKLELKDLWFFAVRAILSYLFTSPFISLHASLVSSFSTAWLMHGGYNAFVLLTGTRLLPLASLNPIIERLSSEENFRKKLRNAFLAKNNPLLSEETALMIFRIFEKKMADEIDSVALIAGPSDPETKEKDDALEAQTATKWELRLYKKDMTLLFRLRLFIPKKGKLTADGRPVNEVWIGPGAIAPHYVIGRIKSDKGFTYSVFFSHLFEILQRQGFEAAVLPEIVDKEKSHIDFLRIIGFDGDGNGFLYANITGKRNPRAYASLYEGSRAYYIFGAPLIELVFHLPVFFLTMGFSGYGWIAVVAALNLIAAYMAVNSRSQAPPLSLQSFKEMLSPRGLFWMGISLLLGGGLFFLPVSSQLLSPNAALALITVFTSAFFAAAHPDRTVKQKIVLFFAGVAFASPFFFSVLGYARPLLSVLIHGVYNGVILWMRSHPEGTQVRKWGEKAPLAAVRIFPESKIFAVHATKYLPNEAVVSRVTAESDGPLPTIASFRPNTFWSIGGMVQSHRSSWDDMPYAVIAPIKDLKPNVVQLSKNDTITLGDVPLTADSIVVVPAGTDVSRVPPFVTIVEYGPDENLSAVTDREIRKRDGYLVSAEGSPEKLDSTLLVDGVRRSSEDFFSSLLRNKRVSRGNHLYSIEGEGYRFGLIDLSLQAAVSSSASDQELDFFQRIIMHNAAKLKEWVGRQDFNDASRAAFNKALSDLNGWLNILSKERELRRTGLSILASRDVRNDIFRLRLDRTVLDRVPPGRLEPFSSRNRGMGSSYIAQVLSPMPWDEVKLLLSNGLALGEADLNEIKTSYAIRRWLILGEKRAQEEGVAAVLEEAVENLPENNKFKIFDSIEFALTVYSERLPEALALLRFPPLRRALNQREAMTLPESGPLTLTDVIAAHPKARLAISGLSDLSGKDRATLSLYEKLLDYSTKANARDWESFLDAKYQSSDIESLLRSLEEFQSPIANHRLKDATLFNSIKRNYPTPEALWQKLGLLEEFQEYKKSAGPGYSFWNESQSLFDLYLHFSSKARQKNGSDPKPVKFPELDIPTVTTAPKAKAQESWSKWVIRAPFLELIFHLPVLFLSMGLNGYSWIAVVAALNLIAAYMAVNARSQAPPLSLQSFKEMLSPRGLFWMSVSLLLGGSLFFLPVSSNLLSPNAALVLLTVLTSIFFAAAHPNQTFKQRVVLFFANVVFTSPFFFSVLGHARPLISVLIHSGYNGAILGMRSRPEGTWLRKWGDKAPLATVEPLIDFKIPDIFDILDPPSRIALHQELMAFSDAYKEKVERIKQEEGVLNEEYLLERMLSEDLTSLPLNDSAKEPLEPGQMIGPFQIEEKLGQGGQATVYKAFEPLGTDPSKRVAVKVPSISSLMRWITTYLYTVLAASVRREASRLEELGKKIKTTPRFIQAGSDPASQRAYVAMELIPGKPLSNYYGKLTLADGILIAEAVAEFHSTGYSHNDMKPENILLEFNAAGAVTAVRIVDVAMAEISQRSDNRRRMGDLLIPDKFTAPEKKKRVGTFKTDVFATGMVLLWALSPDVVRRPDVMFILNAALNRSPNSRPTAAQLAFFLKELPVSYTGQLFDFNYGPIARKVGRLFAQTWDWGAEEDELIARSVLSREKVQAMAGNKLQRLVQDAFANLPAAAFPILNAADILELLKIFDVEKMKKDLKVAVRSSAAQGEPRDSRFHLLIYTGEDPNDETSVQLELQLRRPVENLKGDPNRRDDRELNNNPLLLGQGDIPEDAIRTEGEEKSPYRIFFSHLKKILAKKGYSALQIPELGDTGDGHLEMLKAFGFSHRGPDSVYMLLNEKDSAPGTASLYSGSKVYTGVGAPLLELIFHLPVFFLSMGLSGYWMLAIVAVLNLTAAYMAVNARSQAPPLSLQSFKEMLSPRGVFWMATALLLGGSLFFIPGAGNLLSPNASLALLTVFSSFLFAAAHPNRTFKQKIILFFASVAFTSPFFFSVLGYARPLISVLLHGGYNAAVLWMRSRPKGTRLRQWGDAAPLATLATEQMSLTPDGVFKLIGAGATREIHRELLDISFAYQSKARELAAKTGQNDLNDEKFIEELWKEDLSNVFVDYGTGAFPVVGKTFGPYTLIQEINRGSYGIVFKAVEKLPGNQERTVALKIPMPRELGPLSISGHIIAIAYLQREAKSLQLASSQTEVTPKFIQKGHDPTTGRSYMAMEYFPGDSLGNHFGQLLPEDALKIAEALVSFHATGLVHNDLSPDNILLTFNSEGRVESVKIVDLGSAEPAGRTGDYRDLGDLARTPFYSAPERINNFGSAQSDIYSLGLILADAVTDDTAVRADFVLILARMLAATPADRPNTAELANVLRSIPKEYEMSRLSTRLGFLNKKVTALKQDKWNWLQDEARKGEAPFKLNLLSPDSEALIAPDEPLDIAGFYRKHGRNDPSNLQLFGRLLPRMRARLTGQSQEHHLEELFKTGVDISNPLHKNLLERIADLSEVQEIGTIVQLLTSIFSKKKLSPNDPLHMALLQAIFQENSTLERSIAVLGNLVYFDLSVDEQKDFLALLSDKGGDAPLVVIGFENLQERGLRLRNPVHKAFIDRLNGIVGKGLGNALQIAADLRLDLDDETDRNRFLAHMTEIAGLDSPPSVLGELAQLGTFLQAPADAELAFRVAKIGRGKAAAHLPLLVLARKKDSAAEWKWLGDLIADVYEAADFPAVEALHDLETTLAKAADGKDVTSQMLAARAKTENLKPGQAGDLLRLLYREPGLNPLIVFLAVRRLYPTNESMAQAMAYFISLGEYTFAEFFYSKLLQRFEEEGKTKDLQAFLSSAFYSYNAFIESETPAGAVRKQKRPVDPKQRTLQNERLKMGRDLIDRSGRKEKWNSAASWAEAISLLEDFLSKEYNARLNQYIALISVYYKDRFSINLEIVLPDSYSNDIPEDANKKPLVPIDNLFDLFLKLQQCAKALENVPFSMVALNPALERILIAKSGRAFVNSSKEIMLITLEKEGVQVFLHELGHVVDPLIILEGLKSLTNPYRRRDPGRQRLFENRLMKFASDRNYKLDKFTGDHKHDLNVLKDLIRQIYERQRDSWKVLWRTLDYYRSTENHRTLGLWEGFVADLREGKAAAVAALENIDKKVAKEEKQNIEAAFDEAIAEAETWMRFLGASSRIPTQGETNAQLDVMADIIPKMEFLRTKLGGGIIGDNPPIVHTYTMEVPQTDNNAVLPDRHFGFRLRVGHEEWFAERMRKMMSGPKGRSELREINEESHEFFDIFLDGIIPPVNAPGQADQPAGNSASLYQGSDAYIVFGAPILEFVFHLPVLFISMGLSGYWMLAIVAVLNLTAAYMAVNSRSQAPPLSLRSFKEMLSPRGFFWMSVSVLLGGALFFLPVASNLLSSDAAFALIAVSTSLFFAAAHPNRSLKQKIILFFAGVAFTSPFFFSALGVFRPLIYLLMHGSFNAFTQRQTKTEKNIQTVKGAMARLEALLNEGPLPQNELAPYKDIFDSLTSGLSSMARVQLQSVIYEFRRQGRNPDDVESGRIGLSPEDRVVPIILLSIGVFMLDKGTAGFPIGIYDDMEKFLKRAGEKDRFAKLMTVPFLFILTASPGMEANTYRDRSSRLSLPGRYGVRLRALNLALTGIHIWHDFNPDDFLDIGLTLPDFDLAKEDLKGTGISQEDRTRLERGIGLYLLGTVLGDRFNLKKKLWEASDEQTEESRLGEEFRSVLREDGTEKFDPQIAAIVKREKERHAGRSLPSWVFTLLFTSSISEKIDIPGSFEDFLFEIGQTWGNKFQEIRDSGLVSSRGYRLTDAKEVENGFEDLVARIDPPVLRVVSRTQKPRNFMLGISIRGDETPELRDLKLELKQLLIRGNLERGLTLARQIQSLDLPEERDKAQALIDEILTFMRPVSDPSSPAGYLSFLEGNPAETAVVSRRDNESFTVLVIRQPKPDGSDQHTMLVFIPVEGRFKLAGRAFLTLKNNSRVTNPSDDQRPTLTFVKGKGYMERAVLFMLMTGGFTEWRSAPDGDRTADSTKMYERIKEAMGRFDSPPIVVSRDSNQFVLKANYDSIHLPPYLYSVVNGERSLSIFDPVLVAIVSWLYSFGWTRASLWLNNARTLYNVSVAPYWETYVFFHLAQQFGIPALLLGALLFIVSHGIVKFLVLVALGRAPPAEAFRSAFRPLLNLRVLGWTLLFTAPYVLASFQLITPAQALSIVVLSHILHNSLTVLPKRPGRGNKFPDPVVSNYYYSYLYRHPTLYNQFGESVRILVENQLKKGSRQLRVAVVGPNTGEEMASLLSQIMDEFKKPEHAHWGDVRTWDLKIHGLEREWMPYLTAEKRLNGRESFIMNDEMLEVEMLRHGKRLQEGAQRILANLNEDPAWSRSRFQLDQGEGMQFDDQARPIGLERFDEYDVFVLNAFGFSENEEKWQPHIEKVAKNAFIFTADYILGDLLSFKESHLTGKNDKIFPELPYAYGIPNWARYEWERFQKRKSSVLNLWQEVLLGAPVVEHGLLMPVTYLFAINLGLWPAILISNAVFLFFHLIKGMVDGNGNPIRWNDGKPRFLLSLGQLVLFNSVIVFIALFGLDLSNASLSSGGEAIFRAVGLHMAGNLLIFAVSSFTVIGKYLVYGTAKARPDAPTWEEFLKIIPLIAEEFIELHQDGDWNTCGATSATLAYSILYFFPQSKSAKINVIKFDATGLTPKNLADLEKLIRLIQTKEADERQELMFWLLDREVGIMQTLGKGGTLDEINENVEVDSKELPAEKVIQLAERVADLAASKEVDLKSLAENIGYGYGSYSAAGHVVVATEVEGRKYLLDATARQYNQDWPSAIIVTNFTLGGFLEQGYFFPTQNPEDLVLTEDLNFKKQYVWEKLVEFVERTMISQIRKALPLVRIQNSKNEDKGGESAPWYRKWFFSFFLVIGALFTSASSSIAAPLPVHPSATSSIASEKEYGAELLAAYLNALAADDITTAILLLQGTQRFDLASFDEPAGVKTPFTQKWEEWSSDSAFLRMVQQRRSTGARTPSKNVVLASALYEPAARTVKTNDHRVYVMKGKENAAVLIKSILRTGLDQPTQLLVERKDKAHYEAIAAAISKFALAITGKNIPIRIVVYNEKNQKDVGLNGNEFNPSLINRNYLPRGQTTASVLFVLSESLNYDGTAKNVEFINNLIPPAERLRLENLGRAIEKILQAA